MNRILNPTGGRPLKNEDAQLFQQLLTMLDDLYGRINATSFIISGCEISGADATAGYIYHDGSICTFAGVTGQSFPLLLEKDVTEGTPRTFFDGVSKNSIELTAIVPDVGGTFSLEVSSPRLEEYMLRKSTSSEGNTGTDDLTAMTPARVLGAIRDSATYRANEIVYGSTLFGSQSNYDNESSNYNVYSAARIRGRTPFRNTTVIPSTTSPYQPPTTTDTVQITGTTQYVDLDPGNPITNKNKFLVIEGQHEIDFGARPYYNLTGVLSNVFTAMYSDGNKWIVVDYESGVICPYLYVNGIKVCEVLRNTRERSIELTDISKYLREGKNYIDIKEEKANETTYIFNIDYSINGEKQDSIMNKNEVLKYGSDIGFIINKPSFEDKIELIIDGYYEYKSKVIFRKPGTYDGDKLVADIHGNPLKK